MNDATVKSRAIRRMTAASVALIGACGLAFAVPSSAMAAAPSVPVTPSSISAPTSAGSGSRDLGGTLEHIHNTNTQIKQDIDTEIEHAGQVHDQIHQDADALRQHHQQAWQDAQQAHDDIKNAVDGAYDRAHERHEIIHQDMVDSQQHLDQLHSDLKAEHDLIKQNHLEWVAAREQWHKDFQQSLNDSLNNVPNGNDSTGNGGNGSNGNGSGATGGSTTTAGSTTNGTVTNASQNTAVGSNGSNANASGNAVSNAVRGTLAQTGVALPVLLAVTLGLFAAAYLLKVIAQYHSETSGTSAVSED